MLAWLSWHMTNTVCLDDISAQEVPSSAADYHLRPSSWTLGLIADLEWEVPDHSFVGALSFVAVLRNPAFISVDSVPLITFDKSEADTQSILL